MRVKADRVPNVPWSRRDFLHAASAAGLASVAALSGCAAHGARTSANGKSGPAVDASGPRSLRGQAAGHGLLAGFALGVSNLRNSADYRRLVQEQCSIAVAENAMKWGPLRPTPDGYFFDDADEIIRFTEGAAIKLRGHNLCWHEQLPAWFAGTANTSNARTLLTDHIRTVAGRYAGRIHSWDVVNEAVNIKDGRPDGLRAAPWLQLIGDDYIELAFRTARQADPAALLTYNDYDIEGETAMDEQKRAAVLLLLRRLKQRNVPIDAVGIQSHIKARAEFGYGPSLRRFIRDCRAMDLEVFLTEMDVDDRDLPSATDVRDAGVAKAYGDYLHAALIEPNVKALLVWGAYDPQTWLNGRKPRQDGLPQRPLLFDPEFRAAPAFAAATQAMRDARPVPQQTFTRQPPASRL